MNTKTVCIQNGNTESIKSLHERFYSYQPTIVIVSPSPLLLNGAEVDSKKLKFLKVKTDIFLYKKTKRQLLKKSFQLDLMIRVVINPINTKQKKQQTGINHPK
jgi:hypothetical protein